MTTLRGRGLDAQGGFTLVEAAVALLVAVLTVVGAATVLAAAFDRSHENRLRQEATALGVSVMEELRGYSYDDLATTEGQITPSDPHVDPARRLLLPPDGTVVEDLATVPSAGIEPYRTTETLDSVHYFTVSRYVSQADTSLKRIVIWVEWSWAGRDFEFSTTSLVGDI